MSLSIPKRFLVITAAAYICSFLFFFVLNSIQFAPKDIDAYFKTGWILNMALLQFFRYLIPVQCTAVIFTFSVFYPRTRSGSGLEILTSKNFSTFVTLVIVILLVLTALFFAGSEILSPRFNRKIDAYSYLTKTTREYLKQAKTDASDGRLFEAEDSIKKYLAIKPEDEEGIELYKEISGRMEKEYTPEKNQNEVVAPVEKVMDLSYEDALNLSRKYLEQEDYYSAYYYARIASDLSGGKGEALSLGSRSWTMLSRTAPSSEETEEFELFSQKKRGTELLLSNKPIEAYYLFNQLSIKYPEDPDISKYLKESIRETRKLTYFIDEAEDAMKFPGTSEICFLNTNNDDIRELVFLGKIVSIPSGTYFEDIETISLNSTGIKSHISARYGKLSGDYIILNGIDRENRNIRIYPEYLSAETIPEIYNTLKLNIDWIYLNALGSSINIYKKMNILEMIELEPVITDFGWAPEPLYIEIITRVLNPCGFIILSLAMIAAGWQYRRFSGKIPVAGFIFIPVIVYIVTLVSESYLYAIRLLCSLLLLNFGRAAALGLLVVSQAVLLIVVFLLLAGLRTGNEET